MPGLIGIVAPTATDGVETLFKTMLMAMEQGSRLQAETTVAPDGQWALGRVHLGIYHQKPQGGRDGVVHVLFHGRLDNEKELLAELGTNGRSPGGGGVQGMIAELYRHDGPGCADRLRGSFCAVILDTTQKKLLLISDLTGSYPLYWFKTSERLVFASELKAVLKEPSVRRSLNPAAVADFFSFGFLLGDKTLAADVTLLPPSSVLTYEWGGDRCRLERYANPAALFRPWQGTVGEFTEQLRSTFNGAVQGCLSDQPVVGLALSGGMDTRVILSAVDGYRDRLVTYTVGVKGCADQVIAEQLSSLVGTRHKFVEIDAQYLGEFIPNLRRMVGLTDGMYLTHGLTEMLVRQFLEQAEFPVLLRGHGGELGKMSLAWPFHTDSAIRQMDGKDQFISYMLQRVNYISPCVAIDDLFLPDWAGQVRGGARRSLESSVHDVDLSPSDLCSYVYLMELHRRFTIPSLALFRNHVEVAMPFVSREVLDVLWRAPAAWRDGTTLHQAIIRANHPALLKIRNSNTGAPAGAGPFVEKIMDKLNSFLKRLNIYGYRHYHSFEHWMSQQLLTAVEELLLQADSRSRHMYREATLRRLVEEAKRGKQDYAYLFQVMLILELWQGELT
jgi:asparagine synthase (glutamine-hydrolysing)